MKTNFLISVASAALIGASGIAYAQAPGGAPRTGSAEAPAAAAPAAPAQTAPAAREGSAPAAGKATQATPQAGTGQRAQDAPSEAIKPKAANSEMNNKAGDRAAQGDMKANARTGANDGKASETGKTADPKAADSKAADTKASGTTTGQAGAGGKQLTAEQRTSIRTSITNVEPVTNVNFSISVGSRVPRGVEFHPLPAPILAIYPDYRGYEYILVDGRILVINPRTLEIVAVLDV